MGNNRTKVIFAVVLLLGAGLLVFRQYSASSGPLENRLLFVCVATGDTFTLDREDVVMIPAKNPNTDELTLLPATREDGELRVHARYRGSLQRLREKNEYVDPETLVVRQS